MERMPQRPMDPCVRARPFHRFRTVSPITRESQENLTNIYTEMEPHVANSATEEAGVRHGRISLQQLGAGAKLQLDPGWHRTMSEPLVATVRSLRQGLASVGHLSDTYDIAPELAATPVSFSQLSADT